MRAVDGKGDNQRIQTRSRWRPANGREPGQPKLEALPLCAVAHARAPSHCTRLPSHVVLSLARTCRCRCREHRRVDAHRAAQSARQLGRHGRVWPEHFFRVPLLSLSLLLCKAAAQQHTWDVRARTRQSPFANPRGECTEFNRKKDGSTHETTLRPFVPSPARSGARCGLCSSLSPPASALSAVRPDLRFKE